MTATVADWAVSSSKVRTGREYLRVSYDRSGRERSQDEQHKENDRATATHGIKLGTPYRERGSASAARGSKARDDFDRLIADLERDRFGADVLVLWESSRGSRDVGEWVTLLELCEQRGVGIFVTTHGREYDPANPRDRRSLLEDAVDSEYESAKVSMRAKRSASAAAEAGAPHGRVPYGYERLYHPKTKALIAQQPFEAEAKVVRELFDRLRKGHSLRAIARDFERRGIRSRPKIDDDGNETAPGVVFAPEQLRDMALRPAYAGLRVHRPGSAKDRTRNDSLDGAVKGQWEALVSDETFYAVRKILLRPERKTTKPGKAVHLSSFIVKCDPCGSPIVATYRKGTRKAGAPEYQCHKKGCIRVSKPEVDEFVETMILDWLSRPDVYELLTGAVIDDADLAKVRGELAVARNELDELRAAVAAGRLSVASLVAAEPGLMARVADLEQTDRDLSTPSALSGLIEPGQDVRERWNDAPMSTRREVARMLLTRDMLGEVRITRRPEGRRNQYVPLADRIVIDREATPQN